MLASDKPYGGTVIVSKGTLFAMVRQLLRFAEWSTNDF
jgi:hypothetical protein